MARFNRFFFSTLPDTEGGKVMLEAEEARHLGKVLRLGVGAKVTLFDGSGRSCDAEVLVISKEGVELAALTAPVEQKRLSDLCVAFGPPKGHFDELVVQLAELGVARVCPLYTRYTEIDLGRRDAASFSDRMRRLAIRACKQSGIDHCIEVERQCELAELACRVTPADAIVCDFPGDDRKKPAALMELELSASPVLLIGPEGGWSNDERATFDALEWRRARLPGGVLRTPTAALAAATMVLARRRGGE